MKTTAQQLFKSLSAVIHPQLPLTPRESQKLLFALKDSFRKQLDQRHPSQGAVTVPGSITNLSSTKLSASQVAHLSRRLIDQNLDNILNYPLLARPRDLPSPQVERKGRETKQLVDDAVGWFKSHVANATADERIAHSFMRTITANLNDTVGLENSFKTRLGQTKAGSLVINWTWASGLDLFESRNKDFISLLTRLLVAEGRQDVVWQWVAHQDLHDIKLDGATRAAKVKQTREIIKTLVAWQCILTEDVQSIAREFLEQFKILSENQKTANVWICSLAGQPLSKKIIEQASNLPVAFYEDWIKHVNLWSRLPAYTKAQLALAHPARSDPIPAVKLFGHEGFLDKVATASPIFRNGVIQFGLNAAEVLLAQDEKQKAAVVLEAIRKLLPENARPKIVRESVAVNEEVEVPVSGSYALG